MKNNCIKLNFDDISKEQLEHLFINEKIVNSLIAELYDVSSEKVRSKRRKWDISIYSSKYFYNDYVNNYRDYLIDLMKESKRI